MLQHDRFRTKLALHMLELDSKLSGFIQLLSEYTVGMLGTMLISRKGGYFRSRCQSSLPGRKGWYSDNKSSEPSLSRPCQAFEPSSKNEGTAFPWNMVSVLSNTRLWCNV